MKMDDFIKTVQRFTSFDSIGITALRNQNPGTLNKAREYCASLDLSKYSNLTESEFQSTLNEDTERMLDYFGFKFRAWGTARKAMNLFLRGALYNKYLSHKYSLESIEMYLEIPLDNAVAKGLRSNDKNRELPRWNGLSDLKQDACKKYQEFALKEAEKMDLYRVHLDIFLWLENR
jgi:hypothetical protein